MGAGDNASGLRYDARQRLEAYRARLELPVHWRTSMPSARLDEIYGTTATRAPASWPPWRSSAMCSRACACGASSPATARRCSPELFDDIGADSYRAATTFCCRAA